MRRSWPGDVAHGGDQQAPAQFRRRGADVGEGGIARAGMGDDHACLGGGVQVEVGQAHADDGDQLQVRQTLIRVRGSAMRSRIVH
jgi:hypothetical protein